MPLVIATETVPLDMDAHGVMRVRGSRVTLDTIIADFEKGASAEEIVHHYPSLQLADVYSIIGYYLRHRLEVEEYLCQQHEQADEIRKRVESRFASSGIRERLLTRRKG
jgi:uncharacterized protein (DUF433 family)